jgi:hypothetical protein
MTQTRLQGSTIRTRTFIQLSDIPFLRLECAKCHSALTIPRIDRKNDKGEITHTFWPEKCPACGESWDKRRGQIMAALTAVRSLEDSLQSTAGVLFSFEIAEQA